MGFTLHATKSVTAPSQIVKFVGFILNSMNMTICMVPKKAEIIKSKCYHLMQLERPVQIIEVASVVGLMVSFFAVLRYGSPFYRYLENIKTDALQDNGWDLEGKVMVSHLCKKDLMWWKISVD